MKTWRSTSGSNAHASEYMYECIFKADTDFFLYFFIMCNMILACFNMNNIEINRQINTFIVFDSITRDYRGKHTQ